MIDGKHPIFLDGFEPSKVVQDFATIHTMNFLYLGQYPPSMTWGSQGTRVLTHRFNDRRIYPDDGFIIIWDNFMIIRI